MVGVVHEDVQQDPYPCPSGNPALECSKVEGAWPKEPGSSRRSMIDSGSDGLSPRVPGWRLSFCGHLARALLTARLEQLCGPVLLCCDVLCCVVVHCPWWRVLLCRAWYTVLAHCSPRQGCVPGICLLVVTKSTHGIGL